MKPRHTPSTPRLALALVSATLTAVTLALFVVLPATLESAAGELRAPVAVRPAASAPSHV